jgi:hypothetical protein
MREAIRSLFHSVSRALPVYDELPMSIAGDACSFGDRSSTGEATPAVPGLLRPAVRDGPVEVVGPMSAVQLEKTMCRTRSASRAARKFASS